MRILHISPTYYSPDSVIGGGERYICYMIRAIRTQNVFRDQDHNVLLVFGGSPGEYHLNDEDIPLKVIRGNSCDLSNIDLRSYLNYLKNFDIVIVHQALSAFGLFMASHARLMGKIVFGMDHGGGEHSIVHKTSEVGLVFDAMLAQSQYAQHSFSGLTVPVHVIPGPIDTHYYRDIHANRKKNQVLAVGRLLPHKGFDTIIRALHPQLNLIIAGNRSDIEYFDYLRNLIEKSSKNIQIVEKLSDHQICALMQESSLFVHASVHTDYRGRYYHKPELLGLAPLEALSCGCVGFICSSGALKELNVLSSCFIYDNEKKLSELFIDYIENMETYSNIKNSYEVSQYYGFEQFSLRFIDILKKYINIR